MKKCIACGMPMETAQDYAMEDMEKDYCHYCARPDGSMQSYEEKLESLTEFIRKSQGLPEEASKAAAKYIMRKLPAWQE